MGKELGRAGNGAAIRGGYYMAAQKNAPRHGWFPACGNASYIGYRGYGVFLLSPRKVDSKSIGSGNTTVVFLSAPITVSVSR
jgi:hypothetical protein